jgi:PBP1b-binding outer membrane lipoprotein LpoB
MKNLITILFGTLLITSCSITNKVSTNVVEPNETSSFSDSINMTVSVILPGDVDFTNNYESDTSHYNVYNITYKNTGTTQKFVLGKSLTVADMVYMDEVEKIDTLQTNVLLIDVE